MCDVKSLFRGLSLKEQFYLLKLAEGKEVGDYLQAINLLVTQLAHLGIAISDEKLVHLQANPEGTGMDSILSGTRRFIVTKRNRMKLRKET